jgi:histidyl-tRNA synthetase
LGKGSIKAQLRSANQAGSWLALIVGDQEVHEKTVILRDMLDRAQETVLDRSIMQRIKSKLEEKKRLYK